MRILWKVQFLCDLLWMHKWETCVLFVIIYRARECVSVLNISIDIGNDKKMIHYKWTCVKDNLETETLLLLEFVESFRLVTWDVGMSDR